MWGCVCWLYKDQEGLNLKMEEEKCMISKYVSMFDQSFKQKKMINFNRIINQINDYLRCIKSHGFINHQILHHTSNNLNTQKDVSSHSLDNQNKIKKPENSFQYFNNKLIKNKQNQQTLYKTNQRGQRSNCLHTYRLNRAQNLRSSLLMDHLNDISIEKMKNINGMRQSKLKTFQSEKQCLKKGKQKNVYNYQQKIRQKSNEEEKVYLYKQKQKQKNIKKNNQINHEKNKNILIQGYFNQSIVTEKQEQKNNNNELLHQNQQVEVISSNQLIEGNIKKTSVSRSLKGQALFQATKKQIINNQRQKNQKIINQQLLKSFKIDQTKFSNKKYGSLYSYAANTHQGIVRNYNQDRVSIILNVIKPETKKHQYWPDSSFFAIFDGHGGSSCADFLRDNIHQFVINQQCFPKDPKLALLRGFQKAQNKFIQLCQNEKNFERSGSCAIVALIVGNHCYIANVGDSRAILSSNRGKIITQLSKDHKPTNLEQQQRILKTKGKIYNTTVQYKNINTQKIQSIIGPLRVFPGRLSVSRTIGDIDAKIQKYNGVEGAIISVPEIKHFQISSNDDFIFLASDGIYDKISSGDIVRIIWNTKNAENIHATCGMMIQQVMKQSIKRKTIDNITSLMIGFQNLYKQIQGKDMYHVRSLNSIENFFREKNILYKSKDKIQKDSYLHYYR